MNVEARRSTESRQISHDGFERIKAILQPFARADERLPLSADERNDLSWYVTTTGLTVGDVRRASALLQELTTRP